MQFPLSPTCCLVMRRTGAIGHDGVGELPANAVAEMNNLTLHGWWTQLFRHPDGPPFPEIPPLPERRIEVV